MPASHPEAQPSKRVPSHNTIQLKTAWVLWGQGEDFQKDEVERKWPESGGTSTRTAHTPRPIWDRQYGQEPVVLNILVPFVLFIHIFFFSSFYTGSLMKESQVHGRYLDL